MKIIEENLEGTFLTVLVEITLRRTVAEKVKFINTADVIEELGEKYQITSTVKNNRLSNSMRGGGKQKGSWVFMVKEKQKRKPRTRKVAKPPIEKEDILVETAEEKLPELANPSTKRSIRGRMSSIAKNKKN
tara:strand:- start:6446 stop:6841 length:396 start_codon:yes stop_codon:yes gene_type:complete